MRRGVVILAAIVACITGESVIKAVSDSAVRNTISPLLTHPVCWCSTAPCYHWWLGATLSYHGLLWLLGGCCLRLQANNVHSLTSGSWERNSSITGYTFSSVKSPCNHRHMPSNPFLQSSLWITRFASTSWGLILVYGMWIWSYQLCFDIIQDIITEWVEISGSNYLLWLIDTKSFCLPIWCFIL